MISKIPAHKVLFFVTVTTLTIIVVAILVALYYRQLNYAQSFHPSFVHYVEEKYHDSFTVETIQSNGEQSVHKFYARAHPTAQPNEQFTIKTSQDPTKFSDDYLVQKWQ